MTTAGAIHSELRFETELCEYLAAHDWLYRDTAPLDAGYDRSLALFPEDALAWVKETQPETWERFAKNHTKDPETVFIRRLAEELDRAKPDPRQPWGTLGVLRHGFKDINATFRMAQFAPANTLNPKTWEDYRKNRLRVIRQVHYSEHNGNSIDLVLTLNGLPVATLELKTDTTQSIDDAVRQYRFDRSPMDTASRKLEPLLSFGRRALVHFAVSTDEVRMTTRLSGAATRFLPFNRGNPDDLGGAGAGNPADHERGYATAYLWHDVLARDAFLDILGRYLHVEVKEREDKRTGKKTHTHALLFPRFHQWDAVSQLTAATLAEDVGQTYLVQHSAGSGKSNTIAWLAHRLASLHYTEGKQANKQVFGSVIVITDRRVLDQQLQDTIYQFEHQRGVVEKIDENAQQLAEALTTGKRIVITTLQKFPFVMDKVGGLSDKRFALIIDEAHSSQSGKSAIKLREVLTKQEANAVETEDEDAEELTAEDMVNQVIDRLIAARKRPPNVSYYAFTATPKPKTMELFGRPGADGIPIPFHVYSMQQAIEEDFILDVLRGYTTYDFAFQLEQAGDDKEVKSGRAQKRLFAYAQLHPTSIVQKTRVIVEHFRKHVMHLLNGEAKAMVVADSRLAAVRYKLAFDRYIEEQGYTDCKALVAFSGTINDAENGLTKVGEGALNTNGEKDDSIKEAFSTDAYRLLLVANKFQTGFDEPRLVAMYVDKRLDGVLAVQTLSRLNRTYPGKEKTFVLDFRNKAKDILDAFLPYYRTAKLAGVTDRNLPHQLREKLDAAGIYEWSEIEVFAKAYFNPKGTQAAMQAPLKDAADRFKAKKREDQDVFRTDLSSYVSAYDFLSQLVDYDDRQLEYLHAFARCLLPRLRRSGDGPELLDGAARLAGYQVINPKDHKLNLASGEARELKAMEPGSGTAWDDPTERLSVIIQKMNKVFMGNLTEADFRGYATHIMGKLTEDKTLEEQAKANDTVAQFAQGDYRKVLTNAVVDALESHTTMADQALRDEKVFDALSDLLVVEAYRRLRESPRPNA